MTHPSLNGGSIVVDPGYIDLGERGIWFGIKQGLKYATALFGNTDTIQAIRVQVPGNMAATVATAGDAMLTLTITGPDGSTSAASSKLCRLIQPNYQPNNVDGNVKVIVFQLGNLADGSPAKIDGV